MSCRLGADIKQQPDGLQADGWDLHNCPRALLSAGLSRVKVHEIHAANIRKLTLHIRDMLVDFETLLAKLGLKISGYHVIYGVTFPAENLMVLHVVFRASGFCLGTVRSR